MQRRAGESQGVPLPDPDRRFLHGPLCSINPAFVVGRWPLPIERDVRGRSSRAHSESVVSSIYRRVMF